MSTRRRQPLAAIRVEGVILPPDILQAVAAEDKDLAGIKATDYGLAKTERINEAILTANYKAVESALTYQEKMAVDHNFTYLLGPVKIALRPRIITPGQIIALGRYAMHIWQDCLVLEKMWDSGQLDDYINMDPEELEITRSQPWKESPAILSSDGIFSFGAHREPE